MTVCSFYGVPEGLARDHNLDYNSGMIQNLLVRRVAEVIDRNHLQARLNAGDKLRLKLGIDSNKPDLHLGHAVSLQKLREFQEAGHSAILVLGDYTAQLGDPSDRSEARKLVSAEETNANADAYLKQIFKILDPVKTEVRRNSEWFGIFTLRDVIELMATTTVNNLLSHETFSARIKAGNPLHAQEMLYPLMQGYDSVMVKADVEFGGLDQKFNVLMGRVVQRAHNQPEQDVMLFPYLPGTDGGAKMSKSLGNVINLNDAPDDMFGKVMSMPDSVMPIYFELATDIRNDELARILAEIKNGKTNPRDFKIVLAKNIVTQYHSHDAAQAAEETFERLFAKKEAPDAMETLTLEAKDYPILDILTSRTTLVSSRSEARRLITQNGVKLNREVVNDPETTISPTLGECVIQVGPRRWLKVVWK